MNNVKIKKLHPDARMPFKESGNAGYDVFSTEDTSLKPFERKAIGIGLAFEIPDGYYMNIKPRSGLALKNGLDIMAGVIDSSYRKEVKVVLINLNVLDFIISIVNKTFGNVLDNLFGWPGECKIKRGDKIAQVIFKRYYEPVFEEVDELSETNRGEGFGSSGNR